MTQPDYIETQLARIETKIDQLLARPTGSPAGPGPTPAPIPAPTGSVPSYPADVFGKGWKLTLPINGAQEIKQPDLATYTSKYCELTPNGGTFAANAVVFRAWHGGDTTSGSKNPRSELREMSPDGKDQAAWSCTKGRHQMVVSGQVTRLTKVKPQTVIGQIHNDSDDVTVFRVEADKLWLTDGNNTHGFLLDSAFTLGKPYVIGFDVSAGVVHYTYNGAPVPFTLKASADGCYFKAGNYLQSNPSTAPSESTTEYSEVVLRSVTVTHTA